MPDKTILYGCRNQSLPKPGSLANSVLTCAGEIHMYRATSVPVASGIRRLREMVPNLGIKAHSGIIRNFCPGPAHARAAQRPGSVYLVMNAPEVSHWHQGAKTTIGE
jgi:hypothetical protein